MIQYNLGDKGIDVVGCGCILVAHVPYLDIDDVFERKDFKDYRFWKTTSLGMRFGTAHLTLAVYKDFCCYKKLSPRNPADFKALLLKEIDDAHVQISSNKT
jgi:hypothetical protein